MGITKFEDILAWKKAKELTLSVYRLMVFNRDFDFKNQLCSASVSIMNNIAEGFERQTDKEFIHFLNIAKGSSAEVRSMLYIAFELKYINQEQFTELYNLAVEIAKMLNGLIKSIK
jgi:four helix bundle protein